MSAELFTRSAGSTCLHCGAHVSDRFGRVFGDDRDRAHRRKNCDVSTWIDKGSAAGLDVCSADLHSEPERFGGSFEDLEPLTFASGTVMTLGTDLR